MSYINIWVLKCAYSLKEKNPLSLHCSYICISIVFWIPPVRFLPPSFHWNGSSQKYQSFTGHQIPRFGGIPVLTLINFSQEPHEVDLPSFLKYLTPSLSCHCPLLVFLPTHWLLLSHLCYSSPLVNLYMFLTPFSLSMHSP